MARRIKTLLSRVKFALGEETTGTPTEGFVACGQGTAYPLLATLDQVAELFHRVKKACYTAGLPTMEWDDGTTAFYREWAAPAAPYPPSSPLVAYDAAMKMGYHTATLEADIPIPETSIPYLGEEYSEGGENYRDIGDDEPGIWLSSNGDELPHWNRYGNGFATAFSYLGDSSAYGPFTPATDHLWAMNEAPISELVVAEATFSGEVAVIKSSPEVPLLDPSNSFYIGFRFYLYDTHPTDVGTIGTDLSDFSVPDAMACFYTLRLSSGDLTAQLYLEASGIPTAIGGGDDIMHEATEWWPYATSAGLPAWDTTTGLPINGGPDA